MHHRNTLATLFSVLLVILSCAANAQSDNVIAVLVGGNSMNLRTPAVKISGRALIPLDCLAAIGAKFEFKGKPARNEQKVRITPASGKAFVTNARVVDGHPLLVIGDIAQQLGVAAVYNDPAHTLSLRSVIERIDFDGSELHVSASCPIKGVLLDTSWTRKTNKLVLDMTGAQFPEDKSELKITNTTSTTISTGTHEDGDTARIVVNLPNPVTRKLTSRRNSSEITVSISEQHAVPSVDGEPPTIQPPTPPAVAPETPMISVTGIDYKKLSSRRIEVIIDASGPLNFATSMSRHPNQLFIDLSHSKLDKTVGDIILEHDILDRIRVEQKNAGTVRIGLDLKRIASFDAGWDNALGKFVITLDLPKGAGGLLSQKIIVIDPGHGGHDQGAKGNGALEKDCNLPIALKVQKVLTDAGACAILTRQTDVYLTLDARVDCAIRHSADFFVSIHCNSCPVPNSISGIETYFHSEDPNGRALAQSIHAEVVKASNLSDRHVRSDTILHKAGLAVLRGTSAVGIPSTLVEVGFLNSSVDGCMIVDNEYQDRIAKAVVAGLKQYIEGSE